MTLVFRNAKYSSADQTQIDLEYEHPVHGWIPFTARIDDSEQTGRDLYEAALASGDIAPYAPPAQPVPAERLPAFLAQVRLRISGDTVESTSTDGGLASCVAFEPGLLWCEFPAPVEGEYLVWPSNGATHRCYSLAEEQLPEGFAVRSQSYSGDVDFPEYLQILVTKS